MRLQFLFFALLFVIAACTLEASTLEEQKDAVSDEVVRLLGLTDKGTITEQDFAVLESMVQGDETALDEINEIKTLVKYQEYTHAVHSISFLSEYLRTSQGLLCPGHSLAHYYVYLKHGEVELAEEALEETEKQFPHWKEKVMEGQQGRSLEEVVQAITAIDEHLQDAKKGKELATDTEILYLAEDASICIDDE